MLIMFGITLLCYYVNYAANFPVKGGNLLKAKEITKDLF